MMDGNHRNHLPPVLREKQNNVPKAHINRGVDLDAAMLSVPRNRTPSSSSSRRDLTKSNHPDRNEPVELKKQVGLLSGVALITGTMIGSGIFISPAGVTDYSGSVGLSLIIWTLGGLISLFGALSYAELGTLVAQSGAEYTYLLSAIGPLGRFGDIPAFLFAWVNMVVLRPSSVAIIILTFATYTTEPFFNLCEAPVYLQKCLAIFAILLLVLVNCLSVRIATGVQNFFTACKIIALIIVIIGGFVRLSQGSVQHLNTGFKGTATNPGKVALALYHGMWAYDGWNNLNYVTEEIINPYKNLPRATYIAVPLVTVLYVLANISYFSVMSVDELLASPAVAVTWGNRVLGVMAWLIPFFVACSTIGAVNGSLFSSGRLTYVAAREGHMVELLSMIHIKRHTPLPSLVFTALIAVIMVIPGDIRSLIDFFSFAVWFFYGLSMVALIILRVTRKNDPRPYKVPIFIPVIVLAFAIFLVLAPIIDSPRLEFLYAFMFIVAGLIFYFPFVHFKFVMPGTTAVTTFAQLLMEVSVAESEDAIASC